jgi:hypothetical protein
MLSLQNLAKIDQLEEHATDRDQVAKLLEAATRFLQDARQDTISAETRLNAAYKAVVQYSMVALYANGYRPPKSRPGHHQTMIQSLVHSIDLDNDEMLLLDTFRVKRNATDYLGELVDEGSVVACIEAAKELQKHLLDWLAQNRPDLLAR